MSSNQEEEDFFSFKKCEKLIQYFSIKNEEMIATQKQSRKIKTSSKNAKVPTILNYIDLINYNYSLQQLKSFSKHYNLKVSGTKDQVLARIYTFLHLSYSTVKIQRLFRISLERKLGKLRGPVINLCTNCTDFITMDDLKELKLEQFFSFQDEDGFNYGFDLSSIYNLVLKQEKEGKLKTMLNPYNRNIIPDDIISNLKTIVTLSKVLKKDINIDLEDEQKDMTDDKILELRTLALFQEIDSLGNYTHYSWFHTLNKHKIIKFLRELSDIFNYRSQLSVETKRNICPPYGEPFKNLMMSNIIATENINIIKKEVLEVLEKLINSGINTDSRSLGAYYVLGALTLVNDDAASSLPWLYQSVSHF